MQLIYYLIGKKLDCLHHERFYIVHVCLFAPASFVYIVIYFIVYNINVMQLKLYSILMSNFLFCFPY